MKKGHLQGARTVLYECTNCGKTDHGTIATIPHGWYVILSGDDNSISIESDVLTGGVVEECLSLYAAFSTADVYCNDCVNKYREID